MKSKLIAAFEAGIKEMIGAIDSEFKPHPVTEQAKVNLQAALNSLKLHPDAVPVPPSGVVSPGKGDDDSDDSAPAVTAADHAAATDVALAKNPAVPSAPTPTTIETSAPATIETTGPVTMEPPAK